MCGIVGLFAKNKKIEDNLGNYLSSMLIEMCERGPDSSGVAIYQEPSELNLSKTTIINHDSLDIQELNKALKNILHGKYLKIEERGNHLVIKANISPKEIEHGLKRMLKMHQ